MENVEKDRLRPWVIERIALLDPPSEWQPDPAVALARLHARFEGHRPRAMWLRWPAWAAAAVFIASFILLLPAGRVVAQQLWQLLTVRRIAFVRVNSWPEGVRSPQVNLIGTPIPFPARSLDEVRTRVNYNPRLPRPGVLSGDPALYTTFGVSAGTVVNTADLELALRKAGVTDQTVPPQWNGAQLALHTSAVVIAQWPDIALAQSLPLTLTAPQGFDFPAFSALVLRVLGVGPDDARRLAGRAGTTPPWLAPIAGNFVESGSLEEIALSSGPATLLEQKPRYGTPARITIAWSVPDRVYLLSGMVSREVMIAAANAVE